MPSDYYLKEREVRTKMFVCMAILKLNQSVFLHVGINCGSNQKWKKKKKQCKKEVDGIVEM